MTITPEVQENRRKAIHALRTTVKEQGTGTMYNEWNGHYCAIGVILSEVLKINEEEIVKAQIRGKEQDLYDKVKHEMGLESSVLIWEMNDVRYMTFPEIATALETKFSSDNYKGK